MTREGPKYGGCRLPLQPFRPPWTPLMPPIGASGGTRLPKCGNTKTTRGSIWSEVKGAG